MLYLKKVEIYGFKSFADKMELKFDQPVTGIVGPNGCGKSNISDSIRWVLGEQSTKNLRGKLMQDLIFNGSGNRKSMSYCEVSLFMDNSTRLFPIDMDEVIISRKLYRNNESEYLLNRNVVRLRDIQALLRGVGLGKEGYWVVGQGRMDAILNAKPEDRRAIFEEALGISSFRIKKDETERRLEKTRNNIDTTMVIVDELSKRLPVLKRQTTMARRYLDIYEELRLCEINAYIYGYDHASSDKDNCKTKIAALSEELLLRESQLADVNDRLDTVTHERNDIEGNLSGLRERQVQLAEEIGKSGGQRDAVQARIDGFKREIEITEEQIAETTKSIEELQRTNADLAETNKRREVERVTLDKETATANLQYADICRRVESVTDETETARAKLDEITSAVANANNRLVAFETETTTLNDRLGQIAVKEKELADKLAESEGDEGQLLARYDSLRKQRDELVKTAADLRQQVKDLEYRQFEQNKELNRAQQAFSSENGGIKMLQEFADNYKGYAYAVQNLMQDAKRDAELNKHICGVVANLLKVEPKLQIAIETALGGRLQNIVTEDENDVKYLITYLKQHDYGRATFLPVSSMKPHGIDRAEVLNEPGVLGVASDLVQFDRHYSNVMESLLGGTVVVDTYDNAVKISRKYRYAHRMVTLTGERISNDGSLEGGSNKKQNVANLLSYETQIAERKAKLEDAKRFLTEAENRKTSVDKNLTETRNTYNGLLETINALNVEIATAKEKIETSNTLSNSDKKTILGLGEEKEHINKRLKEIEQLTVKMNQKLVEVQSADKKLREKLEHLKKTLAAETSAKDGMQQMVSDKRYRLGLLNSNIEAAEKEIANNTLLVAKSQEDISSKQAYIGQVKAGIDLLYAKLNEDVANKSLREEMDVLTAKIQALDAKRVQLEVDYKQLNEDHSRLNGEVQQINGDIDKQQFMLDSIDSNLAELQQRVQDEYGITYSAAMQYKQENFDKEAARARISELKQSMQQLGPVNVGAIEELKEAQERYDDYMTQIDDLHRAEDDLNTVLKGLEDDIETRFRKGMEQINDNFKTIFRELFNGGSARLYVENDPNKPLLSQGVEIEAQPPEKKLQNISLLSGGERTMTSCAILFAILKFNPMPFCVLDEIEAALDDANCERIAKYLRKFSDSTQFIVITHKKPTMENADVLYGVTMEERGVSKIVSVKLTEATAMAQ